MVSIYVHKGYVPSKIEWDLTNGTRSGSCDRAIRYSGFFGVPSVGPVGDFLKKVHLSRFFPYNTANKTSFGVPLILVRTLSNAISLDVVCFNHAVTASAASWEVPLQLLRMMCLDD